MRRYTGLAVDLVFEERDNFDGGVQREGATDIARNSAAAQQGWGLDCAATDEHGIRFKLDGTAGPSGTHVPRAIAAVAQTLRTYPRH
jgi:hypothetical protein